MYNWVAEILSYTGSTQNLNSTILQIAGFMAVMLFIITIDIFINGLFTFFRRRK